MHGLNRLWRVLTVAFICIAISALLVESVVTPLLLNRVSQQGSQIVALQQAQKQRSKDNSASIATQKQVSITISRAVAAVEADGAYIVQFDAAAANAINALCMQVPGCTITAFPLPPTTSVTSPPPSSGK